jgi:hypothetical protein
MKNSNRGEYGSLAFRELDQLVLEELNAFEKKEKREITNKDRKLGEDGNPDSLGGKEKWPKPSQASPKEKTPEELTLPKRSPQSDVFLGSPGKEETNRVAKPDGKGEEEPHGAGGKLGENISSKNEGILNEEEEKFIATMAEWLRFRDHKETIIAKIADLAKKPEPKAFEPHQSDLPSQQGPA